MLRALCDMRCVACVSVYVTDVCERMRMLCDSILRSIRTCVLRACVCYGRVLRTYAVLVIVLVLMRVV